MLMLEAYCSQAIGLELLLDCKFFINARSNRQSNAMCYCCWSSFYLWAARFILYNAGRHHAHANRHWNGIMSDRHSLVGRLAESLVFLMHQHSGQLAVCALSLHFSDHSIQTGSEYPCHICWECNLNSVMGISLKDWVRQLLPDDISSSRQSGCSSKADL